jgi:hypothetical protein
MTVLQYDRMIKAAVFADDHREELVEGLVLNKKARNLPHIVAGNVGLQNLMGAVPPGWHVAKRDPITTSNWSRPEPDFSVVRGRAKDYIKHHVTAADVALVVEIADSTLAADQTDMNRVYAASVIVTYWVVNFVDNQLEVYSAPTANGYSSMSVFKPGQGVPVIIDGVDIARVAVAELLPRERQRVPARISAAHDPELGVIIEESNPTGGAQWQPANCSN